MLIVFLLLCLTYVNIGMGMFLMVCFTNQHLTMEAILGKNYSSRIMFAWPWYLKKIAEHYYR